MIMEYFFIFYKFEDVRKYHVLSKKHFFILKILLCSNSEV